MDLTVKDLLEFDCLKGSKVLVGEENLSNKITGITIIERPDISDWLKGGEILLSSLYLFNQISDEDKEKTIRGLSKKASALLIKLNQENAIPEIILRTAEKEGLPIINVPTAVAYIDIMQPVFTSITNIQLSKLNYFLEVQKKFVSLALSDSSINTIIFNLKTMINHEITVLDKFLNTIYFTNSYYKGFEFLDDNDIKGSKYQGFSLDYYIKNVKYSDGKLDKQIFIPIKTVNNLKINLCIHSKEEEISELDFMAIENAITILCLELVKQYALSEMEHKFRIDLIEELLLGKDLRLSEIYERANVIAWEIEDNYSVVKIELESPENSEAQENTFRNYVKNIYHLVLENISYHVPKSIVKSENNIITVLWPINKEDKNDYIKKIKSILEKIEKNLLKENEDLILSAGIGNMTKNIKDLSRSYLEANDALSFGKIAMGKNEFVSFDELGTYRFLCSYPNPKDLDEFISKKLIKLIDYEEKHGTQLLETLEMLIKCNGNASQTAKELYIHHKTVVYRLDRIKEISLIDINDSDEMLEIQLSLKIYRFLKIKS